MLTTTLSHFRKNIKDFFDRIICDTETLIINRGEEDGIVVMSLKEYNSLNATQLERSSKENKKRLDSAIEKLRVGESFQKELLEE